MSARVVGITAASAALLAFACADIVGVTELPEGGTTFDAPPPDGPPPPTGICKNATQIVLSNVELSTLGAASGRVFATSSTDVVSCPTSTNCTNPPPLFTVGLGANLEAYALGSKLVYSLQGPSGLNTGSVHSIGFDGTNDQTLGQKLAYPYWVAASGTKTFWIDDESSSTSNLVPAVVHCIGCGSGDLPWITNLNATHALIADQNDIYVLFDDGSSSFTYGIVACSVNTACGSSPRTVAVGGIDTTATTFASDGTNVYIARLDVPDLIRIDQTGTPKVLAQNISVAALAIDAATGELFFATDGGVVAKVKADGSSSPSVFSNCDTTNYGSIDSIAVDATSVYVLMNSFSVGAGIFAIPRP